MTSVNSRENSVNWPQEKSSMGDTLKSVNRNDNPMDTSCDAINRPLPETADKTNKTVKVVSFAPSPGSCSSDNGDDYVGLENRQECISFDVSPGLSDLPLSDMNNTTNNVHDSDIGEENPESGQNKNTFLSARYGLLDNEARGKQRLDGSGQRGCEVILQSRKNQEKCGKQLSTHSASHDADSDVDATFGIQSMGNSVDPIEISPTSSGRSYGSPDCGVPGASGRANRMGEKQRCFPRHHTNQKHMGHGKGFSVNTPSTSKVGNTINDLCPGEEEGDASDVMYPVKAYVNKIEISFPRKRRHKRDRVEFEVWFRSMDVDNLEKVESIYPHDSLTLENLQAATSYVLFILRLVNSEQVSSAKQHVSTMPFGPPADFTVQRDTEGMVHFEWHEPQIIAPSHRVEGYIITVSNYLDCDVPREEKHRYDETIRAAFLELDKETSYVFCIEAMGGGYVSESNKAEILMPKHRMLKQGVKMETKGKPIFLLKLKNTTSQPGKICRKELGKACIPEMIQKEKVVLVVGATGSGKTTWINAILNYILDVKYTENFRFKLVIDENANNQTISQTRHITIYTIHHQDGLKIDFTLTIIDTPGFGDTRGIHKDKEIETELREIFDPSNGCVDHLDAVGFVAPASSARLTPTQKYIFTSILSLFGVDIGDSIYMLFTFADGKPPQMMSAIKAAKVPYQECFKFNNSAVFDDIGQAEGDNEFEMDDESEHFDRMFWDLGMKSFERFVSKIFLVRPVSLTLTLAVLSEREHMELNVENLNVQVRLGLSKMDQLRNEENLLKKFEDDIESNKDYTYEIKKLKVTKIPIPDNRNTTTCLKCNFTCHMNCNVKNDIDKARCSAMDQRVSPAVCTQCPKRCVWKVHRNICYILEQHMVTEISTLADIKARYEEASGNKLTAEQVYRKVREDLDAIEAEIKADLSEISESLNKLQHIALKNNPRSQIEYLDILIESERTEATPGWQERVRGLQDLRQQAQNIYDIHQGEYDPFKAYREEAIRARREGCDMRHVSTWVTVSNRVKNAVGDIGRLFGTGNRKRGKWP